MEVSIGPIALQELHGAPAPAAIAVEAMIDTGASRTVIPGGVVSRAGLPDVGEVTDIVVVGGRKQVRHYEATLRFPSASGQWQGIVWAVVDAAEDQANGVGQHEAAELPAEPLSAEQCIIGRATLELATLVYMGPVNAFSLSFETKPPPASLGPPPSTTPTSCRRAGGPGPRPADLLYTARLSGRGDVAGA